MQNAHLLWDGSFAFGIRSSHEGGRGRGERFTDCKDLEVLPGSLGHTYFVHVKDKSYTNEVTSQGEHGEEALLGFFTSNVFIALPLTLLPC